ncbi:hypothetical protein RUM43_004316 [Polyplax serrata]|uniref:Glycolipid transfer protein domain-containing protein n=1 Tax=Polyplax serrata TaxID=468196 RepID=A0AAN8SBW4_POLSC
MTNVKESKSISAITEEDLAQAAVESLDEKEEKDFDFVDFCKYMKSCITENCSDVEDVDLKTYLLAYEQLYNFFLLLGRAFQFVASDVKSKIRILDKLCNEELEQSQKITNFLTVKSMVNYERDSGLLKNSKYVSGCRTLLRLHRGLDFIRKFLEEIYNSENGAKLGGVARQTYDKTLAEYHTWIVRNAARVAMQFLPTREELLNKVSKNDEGTLKQMLEMFPEAFENMNTAYNRIHEIYTTNNILDLP